MGSWFYNHWSAYLFLALTMDGSKREKNFKQEVTLTKNGKTLTRESNSIYQVKMSYHIWLYNVKGTKIWEGVDSSYHYCATTL